MRKNGIVLGIVCLFVICMVVLFFTTRTKKYGPEHLIERSSEFGSIKELRRVDGNERNVLSDAAMIEKVFSIIENNTEEVYYYDDYLSAPPPGGSEIIFEDGTGKHTIYLIYDPEYLPCDLAFRIVGKTDHIEEVLCCDLKKSIKSQIESVFLKG